MKRGSIILYKSLLNSFLCFIIFSWSYSSKAQNNRDDKPVNLKVLPSNISENELRQLMDSYSTALGVHCNFCHGNPNDKGIGKTDFGADANPKKNVAREMIKLVNGINTNMLQGARALDAGIGSVSCVSCHHGSASIDLLEDVLFRTYKKKGLDSTISRYNNLKKQYYGSFTYDFSNRALLSFASKVNETGNFDDAITIGKKNCELFPDYTWSFVFIADIYSKNGKKDEAVKNYEKAIQLDPNNRYASQQLRKLQSSTN
jgi:tetratricopeptide (TPR) repeat protein